MPRTRWTPAVTLVAMALGLGACSGGGSDDQAGATTTTSAIAVTTTTAAPTTTAPAAVLHVLVSNDDGVHAAGIDAIVEALRALPDTEVVVVAPAENQSGTGGQTTPGPLTTEATTTVSGYPATSVAGFPADAVQFALDEVVTAPPDLVVTGVNLGQNIGPLVAISGTVGAARAAATRGIPALAVSESLADPIDYTAGVTAALAWIAEHRAELTAGTYAATGTVVNINAPTCPGNTVRGEVEVPLATDLAGRDIFAVDCASTKTAPVDDVDALLNGYVSISSLSGTPG